MAFEENDSIKQTELFRLRIEEKGLIHQSLLEYLGLSARNNNDPKSNNKEEKSEDIYLVLKKKSITTNKCELRDFLESISHLWEIQQSKKEIIHKLQNLFRILKKDIKKIISEKEIFDIFHFNKDNFILLILIEVKILSIETIIKNINHMNTNDWNIIKYLYPEIRKYDENILNELIKEDEGYNYGLNKFVEENDQNLEYFNEIRKEGKKDSKIIEMIKEDRIEEFASLADHSPINLNQKISKNDTIFETSTKKLSLIEYSALFGAVSIFKYLYMKGVDIDIIVGDVNNNIIEYAVQGRKYEIIHILEKIKEINEELSNSNNNQKYLKVSIKMHHNEIFEYLMTKYNIQVTEETIDSIITYRNYQLFDKLIGINKVEISDKAILTNIFYSICKNGNEEIEKILVNQPNIDINMKNKIFDHLFEIIKMNRK